MDLFAASVKPLKWSINRSLNDKYSITIESSSTRADTVVKQ